LLLVVYIEQLTPAHIFRELDYDVVIWQRAFPGLLKSGVNITAFPNIHIFVCLPDEFHKIRLSIDDRFLELFDLFHVGLLAFGFPSVDQ